MSSEQRDKLQPVDLPPPPVMPPSSGPPERHEVWPRVRSVLLVLAFAAAVALAITAMIQHRVIFLAAGWTFATLPVGYLVGGAVRSSRSKSRAALIAGVVVLVGALGSSTIVAVQGCSQRVGAGAQLARCDFHAAVLANEDLTGADLSGADLSGANLRRATLDQANLRGADLTGASLQDASLAGADLTGTRLEGAVLLGADLTGADLSRAHLPSLDLSGTVLAGVTFAGTDLSGADLHEADLTGVSLRDANAAGTNFAGANLQQADLSGAQLGKAMLDKANLRDTVMQDADLSGASLAGASLERADLTDAALAGADLSGTSLIGSTGLSDEGLAEAFGVDVGDLGGTLIKRDVQLEPRDEILSTVAGACRGDAVTEAGSYARGGFNPIVILDQAGRVQPGFSEKPLDLGWEPTAARFVHLVACVGEEETITLEHCPYMLQGGGSATIVRDRFQRRLLVVDPHTGSVVLDETLQGSTPQSCPLTYVFVGGSKLETFDGTHIDFNSMQRDLSALVGRA